ncbi:MAG: LamG domain-containing protein, partial [Candidatus Pacebacteria bacterium]|nr:LamG domain-containing protein [Candidatus Paceibacterota bacterium]
LSALIIVGMSSTTQKANIAKSQVFANSLRNSLMSDMVSEWKLDGNTTDTWAASYANNGTWSGPTAPNTVATYGTASECVSGQCMDFDGVDDMVNCGNNASLSMGTKDHTVSLWVNFDNATAPQLETLVNCHDTGGGTGTNAGYWVRRYTGTSQLYVTFSDGILASTGDYLSPANSLVANNWYNIVVVFDRDASAQAYINGLKQSSSLTISTRTGAVQNTTSYKIGAVGSNYYRLAGKLDEIRIFHALTSISRIQQNYLAGINKLMAKGEISALDYQNRLAELSISSAQN